MRLGLCTAVVNHVGEGEGAALLHERVCALDARQDWLEEAAERRSTLLLSICWRIFCQVGFRVLRRSCTASIAELAEFRVERSGKASRALPVVEGSSFPGSSPQHPDTKH
jgi:hypothetical protein